MKISARNQDKGTIVSVKKTAQRYPDVTLAAVAALIAASVLIFRKRQL